MSKKKEINVLPEKKIDTLRDFYEKSYKIKIFTRFFTFLTFLVIWISFSYGNTAPPNIHAATYVSKYFFFSKINIIKYILLLFVFPFFSKKISKDLFYIIFELIRIYEKFFSLEKESFFINFSEKNSEGETPSEMEEVGASGSGAEAPSEKKEVGASGSGTEESLEKKTSSAGLGEPEKKKPKPSPKPIDGLGEAIARGEGEVLEPHHQFFGNPITRALNAANVLGLLLEQPFDNLFNQVRAEDNHLHGDCPVGNHTEDSRMRYLAHALGDHLVREGVPPSRENPEERLRVLSEIAREGRARLENDHPYTNSDEEDQAYQHFLSREQASRFENLETKPNWEQEALKKRDDCPKK